MQEGTEWKDKAVGSPSEQRFDLLPPRALFNVAELRARAVALHGEQGINDCFAADPAAHINKAIAHLYAWVAGDTSERDGDPLEHLVHTAFRVLVAIECVHTERRAPIGTISKGMIAKADSVAHELRRLQCDSSDKGNYDRVKEIVVHVLAGLPVPEEGGGP